MANKADPRVDSDLDGQRGLGSNTGTTGTGYGSSGYGSTTGSSTAAGPHSSNLANKADPRVDSDLDGKRGLGSSTGTTGAGSGLTGSSGTTGHHGHHGGALGKAEDIVHGGAHHTETANRLDPHVSGGRGPLEHATVEGSGSGLGGSSNTTGGYGSSTGGYGSTTGSSTTAGPHSSNLANKADPRVDSDLDGKRGVGSTTGTSGTTGAYGSSTGTTSGYGSSSGTTGEYGSGVGTGSTSGGYGSNTGTHSGTGYNDTTSSTTGSGSTTAGPHKSNMMNKLDPRVDSDMDGSKMK